MTKNYGSHQQKLFIEKPDLCIMLHMKKFVSLILLFFFISSTFTVVYHPVVASTTLVENSWTTKTSMNQARFGLGVIAVDGKIYGIGGCTSFDDFLRPNNFVGTNERYDPKTDTWTTLKSMPTPRHNFAIAECQGKIYCIGGYIVEGSRWVIYNTVETYDPATDSWSTKADMPFTEADLTACVVNGKIYVFTTNVGSPVYMYNTETDSWTVKTHKPNTTLHYYAPTVVDNKILLTSLYLTTEIYDPVTNEWTEKRGESPLILVFNQISATVTTTGVYAPQKMYVLGKQYGTPSLTNWSYDLVNGTQAPNQRARLYRENFGTAVVDDILYVIGGNIYHADDEKSEILSTNEQYVPRGYYGASPMAMPNIDFGGFISSIVLIVNIGLIGIVAIVVIILFFVFKKDQNNNHLTRHH